MPSSTPEPNLLLLFTARLEAMGLRYAVTGSVASMLYGEPRLTHDVDLVLDLPEERVGELCAAFPDDQFYCMPAEVLRLEVVRPQRGHFNIIHHDSGFKADVYLAGADPLHHWALVERRRLSVGEGTLHLAPPEYVVLRKLEYFREGRSDKHLQDIRAMLRVLGDDIDRVKISEIAVRTGLADLWARAQEDA